MSKREIERFFSDEEESRNTQLLTGEDDWSDDAVGQLSIDMYQTKDDLIVKAPIAGVREEDLEVAVDEDTVSIRGKREREHKEERDNHFVHECYWGSFARVQSLPVPVLADKAEAALKHGVLTIRIPKANKTRGKMLKIRTE